MARWWSEEALHTAVKRREAKGKGAKESSFHLNTEFQRLKSRDKKKKKKIFPHLTMQRIEENNRMGKTTDLFK